MREAIEKGKAHQAESLLPSSEDMLSSQSQPMSQASNFSDTSQGQLCKDLESKDALNSLLENLKIAPIRTNESKKSIVQKVDLMTKKAIDMREFENEYPAASLMDEMAEMEEEEEEKRNSIWHLILNCFSCNYQKENRLKQTSYNGKSYNGINTDEKD